LRQPKQFVGWIQDWVHKLPNSVFVRQVGVLAGGTGLAQALMVLVLPILTRLYTPEDFSVLAVYVSILGIISIAACLRFEIAIPMPERDEEAASLLALALGSSAIISTLAGIAVYLFPEQIVGLVEQPKLRPYLWLLPLGIWLASSYSATQYWATRQKNFSGIAQTRLTQAISGAGFQVGLGWIGAAPFGLLFGSMINRGAGLFSLGFRALKHDRPALRAVSWPAMRRMFREYDRFPKYSTFDSLANTVGIQFPVIIIAAMAVGPEAGFLILAMRAMQAPMGFIGGAVAQVYLSRAPEELRAGNLSNFTVDVLEGLAKTGVGPLLFAGIVAPPVFALVFGEEWLRAGDLVVWMTPWFIFQFLSSPISMVMHVRNRQKAMLVVTVSGLVLRIGAVGFAVYQDQQHLSEYYAVSGALFYLGCYWVFSRVAGINPGEMIRIYGRAAVPLAIWVALGIISKFLFEYIRL